MKDRCFLGLALWAVVGCVADQEDASTDTQAQGVDTGAAGTQDTSTDDTASRDTADPDTDSGTPDTGHEGSIWTSGSLAEAAWESGRRVGAAISSSAISSDEAYKETFLSQFSAWTPENAAKWGWIQGADENTWNFGDADAIETVAGEVGMQMKGHALLWHYSVPAWVGDSPSATDLSGWVAAHIEKTGEHYAGIATDWDVVNEALEDHGGVGPLGLRESMFLTTLGESYIADAFHLARSADPNARLFYNDYSLIWGGDKTNRALSLLSGLVEDGVPVDGVGLQCHLTASSAPDLDSVRAVLQGFADLGLIVHISELDVQIRDLAGPDEERLFAQALVFHRMANACAAQPACDLLTLWGFTDKYSWIDSWYGEDDPLVFDEEMTPKHAFTGLIQGFRGEVLDGCETERLGNTDFEKGADGWSAWGGSLSLDADAARTGGQGVRVSERTDTWAGPTRDIRDELGEAVPYRVSAWIRLDGVASDDVKISVKINDDSGVRYENLATGTARESSWTEVSGAFTFSSISGTPSELTLYVEGPAAGVDLLVDDVSVVPVCETPAPVVDAAAPG